MSKLMKSGKISGVLVIHKNESGAPTSGFSPDEKCPNDKFGMYTNNKDYGSCQKVKWNPIVCIFISFAVYSNSGCSQTCHIKTVCTLHCYLSL